MIEPVCCYLFYIKYIIFILFKQNIIHYNLLWLYLIVLLNTDIGLQGAGIGFDGSGIELGGTVHSAAIDGYI